MNYRLCYFRLCSLRIPMDTRWSCASFCWWPDQKRHVFSAWKAIRPYPICLRPSSSSSTRLVPNLDVKISEILAQKTTGDDRFCEKSAEIKEMELELCCKTRCLTVPIVYFLAKAASGLENIPVVAQNQKMPADLHLTIRAKRAAWHLQRQRPKVKSAPQGCGQPIFAHLWKNFSRKCVVDRCLKFRRNAIDFVNTICCTVHNNVYV